MTETQERFLRTILTRVPLDSVVELHLFPSIRRGTIETGVAVIASVMPPTLVLDVEPDADAAAQASEASADGAEHADGAVYADALVYPGEPETPVSATGAEEEAVPSDIAPDASPRLRILTASYRLTIKGVERGKWLADVQEQADAPLEAVEAVLRGVRQRSTEPADPELVGHDVLMALLAPSVVEPAA